MMFGYATNETDNFMPLALSLSHICCKNWLKLEKITEMHYLRPDAKSQVTIQYSTITSLKN